MSHDDWKAQDLENQNNLKTSFEEYIRGELKPAKELYVNTNKQLIKPMGAIHMPGLSILDKFTGGLRPREFSILCGATGVGKTQFCANLSVQFLKLNVPHYVASVETGPHDYLRRCMSVLAEEDWNTGDPVDPNKLKTFYKQYGNLFSTDKFWLSMYDNRFSVESLIEQLQYSIKTFGCQVAIVDNLNFFMEVTSQQNSVVEMDRVVHSLIMFCKKNPIHIIMVMHPKKTEHGRVESEFDIKGSSTAVQEAHNVFLFNRLTKESLEDLEKQEAAKPKEKRFQVNKYLRELKLAKMRQKGRYAGSKIIFQPKAFTTYQEVCFYES